jgi:hypothetical protein
MGQVMRWVIPDGIWHTPRDSLLQLIDESRALEWAYREQVVRTRLLWWQVQQAIERRTRAER